MEKDTEENTNSNDGESLLKEIESYFKQIRKTCPKKISEEIQTLYDQFITLTKGSEKDQIFEKLEILNTIVNNTSEALKSLDKIPKKTQKYLSELKKATYQLNTIKHISSCITKIYKTGKYKGDYLNGKREGKGIYKYNNGDIYEGEYKNDNMEGKGIMYYKSGDRYEGEWKNDKREGKGIYYYKNGDREMGDYLNGKQIGKHVTLTINGEVKTNIYN